MSYLVDIKGGVLLLDAAARATDGRLAIFACEVVTIWETVRGKEMNRAEKRGEKIWRHFSSFSLLPFSLFLFSGPLSFFATVR